VLGKGFHRVSNKGHEKTTLNGPLLSTAWGVFMLRVEEAASRYEG